MDVALPARLPRQMSTYSTQSVEVLREMILSGQLKSGERINEVAIASALGISRAPLREAIRTLINDGLLTSVTGKGAYVRSFDAKQLEDLYELRIALETHSARLAHGRASAEDVDQLDSFLDETQARMETGDGQAHYPGELDFHLRLVKLSKSGELLGAATSVNHRIRLARSRSGHQSARAHQAFDQHREIVGRLRANDPAGAVELIERHLRESLANSLAIFQREASVD